RARPYHAGLTPKERSQNQELFIRDEVQVICATIAFGMGINKPNVRYVIHYDLSKNIEGYYQETGRAGRDGLPSECLLLFGAGDVVKYTQFIEQKENERERKLAHDQLRQIVHYAESSRCRRQELLGYFGEMFSPQDCGACDNCLSPRATFDGTLAAQKFLSAVFRIRERSGFGVGMNHVVEVLTGADTEKIRRWQHEKLSVYGIGKEYSRPEWAAIGRELVRLGFLGQTSGKMSILELRREGAAWLNERGSVTLTKPSVKPDKIQKEKRAGEIIYDESLFELLRKLRRTLADERDVPPYIVFSDVALREMAASLPSNETQFLAINGVGEKKLKEFGEIFLAEIAAYVHGK
ncbi:MAG: HRDC domain-containing protein, partial [Candidatus Omnitrophica bacterium]|nr:HRDC domain-containing protein [Candidatus Omnitrophota bacterium]